MNVISVKVLQTESRYETEALKL